jgi:hypothetical protein
MPRPFIDYLHVELPRPAGQLTLDFQFAELGFVVGVRDTSRTQPIANGNRDVVGSQDFANLVPMRLRKFSR